MNVKSLRSALERAAVESAARAPRPLRERLSIAPRTYQGDVLDDTVRLVIGMQNLTRMPRWDQLAIAHSRKVFDRSGALLAPVRAPLESVSDTTLEGPAGPLRARIYRPYGLREHSAALVFLHGGGFVLGSITSHDTVCRQLAAAAGCQVISVEYRLAPEHRFPAAIEDSVAAFRAVIRRADELSIDRAQVAVGGDSAGGYLSAQVAITATREGDDHKPVLQLLIYPAVDLTMASPSIRALGDGLFLEEPTLHWFRDHFVGERADLADPAISPLHHSVESLRGLPPAHVQTAGFDPLRDEGLAYANKLREAGVSVEHVHYGPWVHGYLNIAGVLPRGALPFFDAASALRRAFASAR